ncbi:MAG: hypothetical protein AB9846_18005 [Tenuifilaceae bacterium]
MILLNQLPEATFMNYLLINLIKLPLFQYIIFWSKSLAVLFVISDLFLKYFKITDMKNPFSAKDFIRPIVLVTIIVTYDMLMSLADFIVTSFDLYIANSIGDYDKFRSILPIIDPASVASPSYTPPPPLTATQTPPSVEGSTLEKITEIATYIIHPSKLLILIFEFLGNFFSSLIYTSALLIRVFGLFFLRVTGPLFIVLSLFPKFQNTMYEWLRYYIIFTVWILPFYLVNIFFIYLNAQSRTMATYCGMDDTMTAVSVSMIAIFVKFTVTKGTFGWLEKIIKVG